MRSLRFFGRRLLVGIPQIFGVTIVTFWIIRLLPGNPAYELAGPFATDATRHAMEVQLGLNRPIYEQYLQYLSNLVHGQLGVSWFTTNPVSVELATRGPATLELITSATVVILVVGIGGGTILALSPYRVVERVANVYGLLAGAFPDFWLGLVLSFLLFFKLGWLPAPVGRIGLSMQPPPQITGFYTIDSVLTGNWPALGSALGHLFLPMLTLVIVYAGAVLKMTRATVAEMLRSDMCTYARACGLPTGLVLLYALRNALGPIIVIAALTYGYLLGGDVLVENVFSWGGLGSWVVSSVVHSDYFPVQAFVLVAALFNFCVYFAADLLHLMVDPRVEY
jgi:ABC-type dipeptide/oligopeptide/nickel transport system permease component